MLGVGGQDLPLSSFFLGERLGRNSDVLRELVNLFEDAGHEFLVGLVLDEFELSPEEADLFFVPLQGAEDVLVEFERRVLTVLVGLSKIKPDLRVVQRGDDVDLRVESYFAVLVSRLTSKLRPQVLVHGAKYLIE